MDAPEQKQNGVTYNCGGLRTFLFSLSFYFLTLRLDCGSEVILRPGDIVICRECGYRILYKKRTKHGK
jgi:hypothetical protein